MGKPAPPHPLSAVAQAEWDRMVERLAKNQVLTIVDDAVLYQYCQLYEETESIQSDTLRLRKFSQDLMELAKTLQGQDLVTTLERVAELEVVLSKQFTKLRQGHLALRTFLVEFGMTPAARSRVERNPIGGNSRTSAVSKFRRAKHGGD
jgi:P27 family predicted phage terminase small subunit